VYSASTGTWRRHCSAELRQAQKPSGADVFFPGGENLLSEDGADFYKWMQDSRGISLGPSVQWIESLERGHGTAACRMRPCSAVDDYRLGTHPGFIDACLQLFYAALPFGTGKELFLFSSASRITITGPLAGCYAAHARLDDADPGGKVLLGSMFVAGEDCLPVVEMAGVEMKKTSLDIIGRLTARPSGPQVRPESQRMEFAAGTAEIRRRIAEAVLVAELESALGERLTDADMPLTQLGVDSITAMELRAAVSARLGADVPTVAFIDGTALNGLIEKVVAAPESAAAVCIPAGFSEDRI
jgi:hypothetical protein